MHICIIDILYVNYSFTLIYRVHRELEGARVFTAREDHRHLAKEAISNFRDKMREEVAKRLWQAFQQEIVWVVETRNRPRGRILLIFIKLPTVRELCIDVWTLAAIQALLSQNNILYSEGFVRYNDGRRQYILPICTSTRDKKTHSTQ